MGAEKSYENKIKSYLTSIGCYSFGTEKQEIIAPITGYWEKRWGGGQFTKSGLPDMHVVLHNVSIELEIKSPSGKPTELQLKNLDLINKGGCYGFVTVETHLVAVRLKKWIKDNYPQYSHIEVIDFEQLKQLCEKILKN